MKVIGKEDVKNEGGDLKIHDAQAVYRQAVAQIKYDPLTLGALVTTHKIDLLTAAKDVFDYLDSYAKITGEVSSIFKDKGKLEGHAKDPISSGLRLDAITGKDYFKKNKGHMLCFGARGSAIATFLHLANKKDKVDRLETFIFVNRSQGRLDHTRKMIEVLDMNIHGWTQVVSQILHFDLTSELLGKLAKEAETVRAS